MFKQILRVKILKKYSGKVEDIWTTVGKIFANFKEIGEIQRNLKNTWGIFFNL